MKIINKNKIVRIYGQCIFTTINHDYLSKNVSKHVPQMIYKNESLMHDRVILRKDYNYAIRKKTLCIL